MITASEAVHQAIMTSTDYMRDAVNAVCEKLDIDQGEKDWQKKLAPFAPVVAAMISAMVEDYATACKMGVVREAVSTTNVYHYDRRS